MGPKVAVLSNVVASKQSLEALQQHGYSRLELRVRLGPMRFYGGDCSKPLVVTPPVGQTLRVAGRTMIGSGFQRKPDPMVFGLSGLRLII